MIPPEQVRFYSRIGLSQKFRKPWYPRMAVSYLWIGLHAISNDWVILAEIKPFNDELLLFLLMFMTGINGLLLDLQRQRIGFPQFSK